MPWVARHTSTLCIWFSKIRDRFRKDSMQCLMRMPCIFDVICIVHMEWKYCAAISKSDTNNIYHYVAHTRCNGPLRNTITTRSWKLITRTCCQRTVYIQLASSRSRRTPRQPESFLIRIPRMRMICILTLHEQYACERYTLH